MFPQIDPVIFSVGPIAVRWYGLMYLIALGFAYFLAMREVKAGRSPYSEQQVSDLLFYGFMGAVLGGRIGYVFFYQFERFLADPLYLFQSHKVVCRSTVAYSVLLLFCLFLPN
jgi:phosphatidylglycerol:prolipoprotein diacylglycerol transferase